MIKHSLRFLAILSVVLVTTLSAHADSDKCIHALATDIVNSLDNFDTENDSIEITSDGLIEFFTKNIDTCRDYLLNRTSPDEDIYIEEDGLLIDITWDYIVEEVAAALTTTSNKRQLFVCENNRSYQAGIDAALWATTIVAAVFSGGTGGVAIQGAKVAVKEGAKGLIKFGVKKGGRAATKAAIKKAAATQTAKKLGVEAGKEAAVKAAQKAATDATKKAMANTLVAQTKEALKTKGGKRISKQAIKKEIERNIANGTVQSSTGKQALTLLNDAIAKDAAKKTVKATTTEALATAALKRAMTTFAISTPIAAAGGLGIVYSFLESGLDTQIMNCTDTDKGEGCYTSCTKDNLNSPTDDLNAKVFKPILGKRLCIDEKSNYVLREINNKGVPSAGDVFMTTQEQWEKIKSAISSTIQNSGNCDWNEDDIDMYIGVPLYDQSTLLPQGNGDVGLLIDGIRIDD